MLHSMLPNVFHLSAKVLTMSDSNGFIFDKDGINEDKLKHIMFLKDKDPGISEYLKNIPTSYVKDKEALVNKCDVALPCATQMS